MKHTSEITAGSVQTTVCLFVAPSISPRHSSWPSWLLMYNSGHCLFASSLYTTVCLSTHLTNGRFVSYYYLLLVLCEIAILGWRARISPRLWNMTCILARRHSVCWSRLSVVLDVAVVVLIGVNRFDIRLLLARRLYMVCCAFGFVRLASVFDTSIWHRCVPMP